VQVGMTDTSKFVIFYILFEKNMEMIYMAIKSLADNPADFLRLAKKYCTDDKLVHPPYEYGVGNVRVLKYRGARVLDISPERKFIYTSKDMERVWEDARPYSSCREMSHIASSDQRRLDDY
jgi:hypothetical protein